MDWHKTSLQETRRDGLGREVIGRERAESDGTGCSRTGRGGTRRDETEHEGTG